MSAGNFVTSRYEDDRGTIYGCRVQPETLAATLGGTANAAPTGAVTAPNRARMTGSRRAYGTRARSVRLRFTATAPDGYSPNDVLEIPMLTPGAYAAATATPNVTGTYLGVAVEVLGGTPESRR